MNDFKESFSSSLNSQDLYDPDLPLRTARSFGGTMIMWKIDLDPYVTIHPVSCTSFLPLIFNHPDHPVTIHIAVYLPTAGRDCEFGEDFAGLNNCISELHEKYPEANLYLRGDFNVNKSNFLRVGLLNFLCDSNGLEAVDIDHQTYHHFQGNGASDSCLDYLLYCKESPSPEKLIRIHCKLDNPLIESHHDVLVSSIELLRRPQAQSDESGNISAPKVLNNRSKVIWSESGIHQYRESVTPKLLLIQQLWLNSPSASRSLVSLCLQSTYRAMTECANSANKAVHLGRQHTAKSSFIPLAIRQSQNQLLKSHKRMKHYTGNDSGYALLSEELKAAKAQHRKLLRTKNAQDSFNRDSPLFSILEKNPKDLFRAIKRGKQNSSTKIHKLTLGGKTYQGEYVSDGFYDSIQDLKTFKYSSVQDKPSYHRYSSDYHHILSMCGKGPKIPEITLEKSSEILRKIRPNVNDLNSITANHFLHAGETGFLHYFLLLKILLNDVTNITITEVNVVHATILFKGHSKDKTLARSYRTISTCPLVAKGLDIYLRDINLSTWNADQALTQYLGDGSSHGLAALLLTETLQYSKHVLHQPAFVLYLDARAAFDNVLIPLLIRNLYICGTVGEGLSYINNRLVSRKTYPEWNKTLMGPINDEVGVEQGGVNSGDFYKIYAKNQLQMAQDSKLGVKLPGDIVVSAIGQADDTVLVANNLQNLQSLLLLSQYYCAKFNVELSSEKTVLQGFAPKKEVFEFEYLKKYSPVNIKDKKVGFHDTAEHVGVIRAVTGNLPHVIHRISAHKKAVGAVLQNGLAQSHRANHAARLKVEQIYGTPVLLSGLSSLVLTKHETTLVTFHHRETLRRLLRLFPKTPQSVIYFLSGSLPGEGLLHLQQLALFGMITRQQHSILHKHACNALTSKVKSWSWFQQLREVCLQYQLPHPLTFLASPLPKEDFKLLVKKHVINYWEIKLRQEVSELSSLKYFQPQYMSLVKPHHLLTTAGSSPYEVTKAGVQAILLSGRYRTELLCRHWSNNPEGFCLTPSCNGQDIMEDIEHILASCKSLAPTRVRLAEFTSNYVKNIPVLAQLVLELSQPTHKLFVQFLLDCSAIPSVITLTQLHGKHILSHLFKITRTWCYSIHKKRLQILGRWAYDC